MDTCMKGQLMPIPEDEFSNGQNGNNGVANNGDLYNEMMPVPDYSNKTVAKRRLWKSTLNVFTKTKSYESVITNHQQRQDTSENYKNPTCKNLESECKENDSKFARMQHILIHVIPKGIVPDYCRMVHEWIAKNCKDFPEVKDNIYIDTEKEIELEPGDANYTNLPVGLPFKISDLIDVSSNSFVILFAACIVFSMFLPILGNNDSSMSNVRWEVDTPIVFGRDITLKLSIPAGMHGLENGSNSWRGGPNNTLLVLGNVSTDERKYGFKIISDGKKSVYMLIIKSFSETDLHCQYTCRRGFDQYKKSLTLDSYVYERHPTEEAIYQYIYIVDNMLHGQVSLDAVYPTAHCQFSYGATVINDDKTNRNETHNSVANVRVDYSFNFRVKRYDNCANITMNCSIGTFNMSKYVNVLNCTDKKEERKHKTEIDKIWILVGSTISVIFIVLTLVLILWKGKCNISGRLILKSDDEAIIEPLQSFCKEQTEDK